MKFAFVSKIFQYFCPILSLTTITGKIQTFKVLDMVYLTELSRQKMFSNFFTARLKTFLCFAIFSIFLYELFSNKFRKLEVAESNRIMEYIPISLCLTVD